GRRAVGFRVWSFFFFFSSRRRHTRFSRDWSSDVCSSDLAGVLLGADRERGLRGARRGGQGGADVRARRRTRRGLIAHTPGSGDRLPRRVRAQPATAAPPTSTLTHTPCAAHAHPRRAGEAEYSAAATASAEGPSAGAGTRYSARSSSA